MEIENGIEKKFCPECRTFLPVSEFKKLTSPSALEKNPDGYYWCCIACYKQKVWVFASDKAPQNRQSRRRDKLAKRIASVQSKYGLSDTQYQEKISEQKNACGICGGKTESKVLCVDHDHKTGKVRGLLCGNCNVGLGNLKDNIQILEAAIAYLKKYGTQ